MTNHSPNEYYPDYVSPPAETLLETMDAMGLSRTELAHRMHCSIEIINGIIKNKTIITDEIAEQLASALQIPASFWKNLEREYQESLIRQANDPRLPSWVEWLKEIPVRDLIKRGLINKQRDKHKQVLDALQFFGVASPDALEALLESKQVAYRQSQALGKRSGAIAAWLRQGELKAQEIECAPYREERFRDVLFSIRALTVEQAPFHQLVALCAQAGVAVVFVPIFRGDGMHGATQWLSSTKALIQLSLRYKTDHQFWFTFFHEAGHLLLHATREVFLEGDQQDTEEEEREADTFASDILIPSQQWQQFIAQRSCRTKIGIKEFAQKTGIAPGIVVGRLQHDGILPHEHCNELKRRLEWIKDEPTFAP